MPEPIVGTPFSMRGGSPEPPVREAGTLRSKDQGHAFHERSMSLCGVSGKEKRGAARRETPALPGGKPALPKPRGEPETYNPADTNTLLKVNTSGDATACPLELAGLNRADAIIPMKLLRKV